MDRDYEKERAFLVETLYASAEAFFDDAELKIDGKGDGTDIVTSADKETEKVLTHMIKNAYPECLIIGEEFSPDEKAGIGIAFTIDPIDGTINFAHGVDMCGIMVSMLIDKVPVAAAIYLPRLGKMYSAAKGTGAYCNDKKIKIELGKRPLNRCVVVYGMPHDNWNNMQIRNARSMLNVYSQVSSIRIYGAGSFDFMSVVEGISDAAISYVTNVWDLCPPLLICKEAGCIVTELTGKRYEYGDRGLIVSNSFELHSMFVDSIKRRQCDGVLV